MLPEKFKTMFGLKDEKDLKMANNIWKMLDEMSSSDPEAYQKFIQKNISQGLTDAKQQKQKRQKPHKITPTQFLLVQLKADLHQQLINSEQINAQLKQKLDMNLNKEKWSDVRAKFAPRVQVYVNICHSERVKPPTMRGMQGKEFNVSMVRDIENLYYSLQGPLYEEANPMPKMYFCIIFNTNFVKAFQAVQGGRRIFLGICAAYFEERLKNDRNPVLNKVNTHALYGKNLYYKIDKASIQLIQGKKFLYGKNDKACQFLLEREVDTKERQSQKKQKIQQVDKKEPKQQKQKKTETKSSKKQQILLHPPKQPQTQPQLPPLLPTQQAPHQKKILIQVLDQHENKPQNPTPSTIPYELKQSPEGYHIEFLVHGVEKIEELDLEVSADMIKLKTLNREPRMEVKVELNRRVDENKVKAKMKKKLHILAVSLGYASV